MAFVDIDVASENARRLRKGQVTLSQLQGRSPSRKKKSLRAKETTSSGAILSTPASPEEAWKQGSITTAEYLDYINKTMLQSEEKNILDKAYELLQEGYDWLKEGRLNPVVPGVPSEKYYPYLLNPVSPESAPTYENIGRNLRETKKVAETVEKEVTETVEKVKDFGTDFAEGFGKVWDTVKIPLLVVGGGLLALTILPKLFGGR